MSEFPETCPKCGAAWDPGGERSCWNCLLNHHVDATFWVDINKRPTVRVRSPDPL